MKQHIAVIGAGAFGGWTALMLQRRGFRVTLVEAWSAGNSRASSGDENRIIRSVYADRIYVEMAQRSAQLWLENEAQFGGMKIFHPVGVLNLNGRDATRWTAAAKHFQDLGINFLDFSPKEAAKRYPFIHFDGIENVSLEVGGGYLLARMGCYVVAQAFVREGGTLKIADARPLSILNERLEGVRLSDGSTLVADQYIFACGAWLGKIFPSEIGQKIRPTRQEVFYFGVPSGSNILSQLPVWCDYGAYKSDVLLYGIPASGSDAVGRGFKVGKDVAGADFDPDDDERLVSPHFLKEIRDFVAHRFPILRGAPLIESRVCQYENTPDAHFILDKLPTAANVWIVGGGSGHGYKHGAAVGEMMADLLLEKRTVEPTFSFARFSGALHKVERR